MRQTSLSRKSIGRDSACGWVGVGLGWLGLWGRIGLCSVALCPSDMLLRLPPHLGKALNIFHTIF